MELDCLEVIKRLGKWSATDNHQPLYRLLAEGLKKAISENDLPSGTRLPPERTFAKALAVSRSTVVAAYEQLREESWLESRQGSGTKVLSPPVPHHKALGQIFNPRSLGTPVFEQMLDYTSTHSLIDFSSGTPAALNLDKLGETRLELSEILKETRYLPQGLLALRQTIARYYTSKGVPTTEDQILITSGAQQAITLITNLYLKSGDLVLLENPTYFGAMDAFRGAGARLFGVAVDPHTGIKMDLFQNVLNTMRPRFIYLTPTFQNPTGAVMPLEHRRNLVQLAEQNELVVVEDNTLAELELSQVAPPPLAAFSQSNAVITIGSMSKLFWVGLRVGWIRAAPATITRLTRLKVVNDLGSGLINQFIAMGWLEQIEAVKQERKQELLLKRNQTIRLLQQYFPEWEYNYVSGGLFLWVKLGDGSNTSALALAQLALRYNLMVLPGSMMSPDESYNQYIRLPFLHDSLVIDEGISRLRQAWQAYKLESRFTQPALNVIV